MLLFSPPTGSLSPGFIRCPISVLSVDLPADLKKRLPRRPIGATLIGRMARDLSLRRKGVEGMLLMDALHKAWKASKIVSSWAVVVDARQSSRRFCIDNEFSPFASQPERLFLLMGKIELLFG